MCSCYISDFKPRYVSDWPNFLGYLVFSPQLRIEIVCVFRVCHSTLLGIPRIMPEWSDNFEVCFSFEAYLRKEWVAEITTFMQHLTVFLFSHVNYSPVCYCKVEIYRFRLLTGCLFITQSLPNYQIMPWRVYITLLKCDCEAFLSCR